MPKKVKEQIDDQNDSDSDELDELDEIDLEEISNDIDASNDSDIDETNDSDIDETNDSDIDETNDSDIDETNDSDIDETNDSEKTDVQNIFHQDLEFKVNEDIANLRIQDNERISKPIMTKYEVVRLIGIRTKQITLGAKKMVHMVGNENASSYDIAVKELQAGATPLKIRRPMPDGRYEEWSIDELERDLSILG
uniref:Uncharacterized protein n=1 Tax=Megaviridae environmental sample TaxID=1737588 RepID=A0A5J6VJP4_9VIRU|nr:MAG: hypothetical protein [Megaviridae environmental sample]